VRELEAIYKVLEISFGQRAGKHPFVIPDLGKLLLFDFGRGWYRGASAFVSLLLLLGRFACSRQETLIRRPLAVGSAPIRVVET